MRYIPRFILQQYEANILKGKFSGFALFFDIADFTPITNQLSKHGKQGAEELRAFLDHAFGEPIRIVESYGGFVTLFAGDAFCAVFPNTGEAGSGSQDSEPGKAEKTESCHNSGMMSDKNRILNAVIKITNFSRDKAVCQYRSSITDIRLKIRQTVSYGEIKWKIFKNSLQNEYVFYGKPLKDLAKLSGLKKDLVFSKDAAGQIGLKCFLKIKKNGYIYSGNTKIKEYGAAEKKYACSGYSTAMSGFINPKYQIESPQPEIRPAAFCFANLGRIAVKDRQEAIGTIQELADKYGGFVARYDATDKGMVALILFGMPISEEKTLERICRFSIEAVTNVPLLALGLAKGNVYAGYTGSGDIKEYTALGDPVNLAARLMSIARPGEAIADSLLYGELMDKFLFEKIGSVQLKGIKQAITVYSLQKQLVEGKIGRQTNFTGRDKFLTELRHSLNEALGRYSNLAVYIYGNAGIGKSRLGHELTSSFPEQEFYRFFLYCDSVIRKPLEPVKQIIRQYFSVDSEKDQQSGIISFRMRWKLLAGQNEELLRIESIIASIIGYEWEKSIWSVLPAPEKPKQQRTAFLRFMAQIAAKKPVVIHLDDSQWIDEESKEHFQALSQADIKPVQIICSCRYHDDGSKPDLGLKNHIKMDRNLGMLDEESSREMIRQILKLDTVPQDTFRIINSRAMGNPFFIEQLCAYLTEIEKIDREGMMAGEPGPVASFRISDIIGSRIDRLTANVRECVYNASVLGMEFNVNILSKMLKRPLVSDLEYGKSSMIWRDLEELHYIFSHIMIKDTAYLRIMYSRLKNLHNLAAEAMQTVYRGNMDEHAQEIAFHYERADIMDKCALYYDKAGCWFRDKYNFTEGETFLKKALKIREKLFGIEHPDTAQALTNLADLYRSQAKYSDAEPLYKHALRIREKVLGKDHAEVASSLHSLAVIYYWQGKYEKAELPHKRALKIREDTMGKDHPSVARSLNSLAELYRHQGSHAEAEPLYNRSLQIFERALGKKHPDVAISLNNLASLYKDQGKYREAEPLFYRSLKIWEKSLGKYHPHVAVVLGNLASLYHEQARYKEAEPLFRRSLRIREKSLGKYHPLVTGSLNGLANLCKDQGKYEESESLYKRSLEIREKSLGKCHPNVAGSLNNLAGLYREQGRYAEAESLYMRSLQIREKVLGTKHSSVAQSLNNLALLYADQGKYAEAEPMYKRALQIWEIALGKDHPYVAGALHNLANLYKEQGRYAEAEPMYKRSFRIRESVLGKNHPDVIQSLNNMANLYKEQSRFSDAEPLFVQAVQTAESVLGSNNSATLRYREDLKECQEAIKKGRAK